MSKGSRPIRDPGGYIKVYRKMRDNWKWPRNRPYSLVEAWLDLLMDTEYRPRTREVSGRVFKLGRGESVASIRFLSDRWNWSRNRTERFLRRLESEHEVSRKVGQRIGQLTILKYDYYNSMRDTGGETDRTLTGHRQDKPNKGNIEERKIDDTNDHLPVEIS